MMLLYLALGGLCRMLYRLFIHVVDHRGGFITSHEPIKFDLFLAMVDSHMKLDHVDSLCVI